MEATQTDVLWAKKAILKQLAEEVKADEDAAKAQAVEDFKAGRGGQVRSPMFGNKAGCISVREGEAPEHVTRFQVGDPRALADWMDEQRPDTDRFAADNLELFARWHFENTGELPDGCQVISYDTEPGEPTAAITVKHREVIGQLLADEGKRAALSGAVPLLLGGGDGAQVQTA